MSAKKKLLVSSVAIIASLCVTSLLMPGCFGRECDGDEQSWGPPRDVYDSDVDAAADAAFEPRMVQGHLVDENTWESTAIDDNWLAYLHERTWHVYYPQLGGRQPDQITAYISANENPAKTNDSLTAGGGNVAKFFRVRPDVATVRNDTCADFFVRLVVHVPPYVDGGVDGAVDAGTNGGDSGSVQDASNSVQDASKD